MLSDVGSWYTCIVTYVHMMSTSSFIFCDVAKWYNMLCHVRRHTKDVVTWCSSLAHGCNTMFQATFMLSYVGQCLHVMYTCCIMLRCRPPVFSDIVNDVATSFQRIYICFPIFLHDGHVLYQDCTWCVVIITCYLTLYNVRK